MAIPISSFLSKASQQIPFLLEDKDLRGGYRVVGTQTALNAIHVGARLVGMLVFVTENTTFYQWDGSLWQTLDVTKMVSIGNGLMRDENNAIAVNLETLDGRYAPGDHTHEGFAAADHDHDEQYAPVDHTHEGFAPAEHTHEGFASADHDHDDQYAPAEHTHEGFAAADHDHDEQYAPVDHTHEGFASADHNHDEQYAPADHTHEGFASINHQHAFASLTEIPKVSAMPGVTISTSEPAPTDGEDGDIWFVVAG